MVRLPIARGVFPQELGVVNVSLGQASDPLLLVRTSNRCVRRARRSLAPPCSCNAPSSHARLDPAC